MEDPNDPEQRGEGEKAQANSSNNLVSQEVVGYLVLIIVAFGVGVGYFAFNYVTKDSERLKFWVGFMFSFTALVVIIVQSVIYVQQAAFMREQINLTRIAERGYVGIEKARLVNGLTIGERPIVRITFRNGGRTPIWSMRHPTRIKIGTTFPPGRPIQFPGEGGGFLPAGLTRDTEYIINKVVTQEFVDDITSGRVKIFINGENHFKDCWKERRVEPFKLVYMPRVERFAEYFARPAFPDQDWALPIGDGIGSNQGEANTEDESQ